MKRLFRALPFFILLWLTAAGTRATHIVGGEFRLTYSRGETYNLGLTLYFDDINGSQGALDQRIRCNIFEKGTRRIMDSAIMEVGMGESFVTYDNLQCLGQTPLRTRILRYNKDITLPSSKYTHPGGYYVVWERCCRNNIITNIESPGGTGQAFYLEFPAVQQGTAVLRNSSPQNFAPLAALGCIGRRFTADFSGRDPDGDQIIYSLATPLAGNSDSATPGQYPFSIRPLPGPYRTVRWASSYTTFNQIGHADPLRVDPITGELSFTPDRQGLFVFAIKAEEFRNGRSIGFVQREFQLLVKDCPLGSKPELEIRPDSISPPLTLRDTVTVPRLNGTLCMPLFIGDTADSQTLTITSPNLPSSVFSLIRTSGATPGRRNPFRTTLCIDPCPGQTLPEYGIIRVVTTDRTCPQPLRDTSEFYLRFPPVSIQGSFYHFTINGQSVSFDPADPLTVFAGDTMQLRLAGTSTEPSIRIAVQEPRGSLFLNRDSTGTIGDTVIRERYRLIAACEPDTSREYSLVFYLQAQACRQTFYLDTISIRIKVVSRGIDALLTVFDSSGQVLPEGAEVHLEPGQPLLLRATGRSVNTIRKPNLFYRMSPAPATTPRFFSIPDDTGQPLVFGELAWEPGCADTASGDSAYRLAFLIHLVGCPEEVNAESTLKITVKDREAPPILIPNIITLNGDGLNETFRIRQNGDYPLCTDPFERVEIFNRWGKRVFSSVSKDFTWAPPTGAAGTHHFLLKYARKSYKGWIEVVAP